jgi:hypothetical protein
MEIIVVVYKDRAAICADTSHKNRLFSRVKLIWKWGKFKGIYAWGVISKTTK